MILSLRWMSDSGVILNDSSFDFFLDGYSRDNPVHHQLLLCLLMTSCDLSDQTKSWTTTKKIAVSLKRVITYTLSFISMSSHFSRTYFSNFSEKAWGWLKGHWKHRVACSSYNNFTSFQTEPTVFCIFVFSILQELIYREFFTQGDLEKAMGLQTPEMFDREKAFIPELQINFLEHIAQPVFQWVYLLKSNFCHHEHIFANICLDYEELSNSHVSNFKTIYVLHSFW